jgi:hypothetical protein
MERRHLIPAALAGLPLLLWALVSPIGSQTVIVPSKEDRILEKLDQVLTGQKALREAVERIERKVGAAEEPRKRQDGGKKT